MITKKCRDYPRCYGKRTDYSFGFDFFKFAGSAAGTAETGFNDLTFKVSPLEGTNEITGAEDEAITAYNEQLGFDGYGKFENLPYGDYLLEEVEAPEGFQNYAIRNPFYF